jgi:hypothetical protein
MSLENLTTEELANEEKIEQVFQKIDQEKLDELTKELDEVITELDGKEYAVSMDANILKSFEKFMNEKVEWRSKEALGVKEILKRVEKVKKEGIKDGVCYFTNLEIEASHYFIMKWSGTGSKEIDQFVTLWKTFEESLILVQQDNIRKNNLEKELAAAAQGISAE